MITAQKRGRTQRGLRKAGEMKPELEWLSLELFSKAVDSSGLLPVSARVLWLPPMFLEPWS